MNDTVFGPSTSLNKKKQVSTSFPTSFAVKSNRKRYLIWLFQLESVGV